jgi:sphingolipid delta-4 desaturase
MIAFQLWMCYMLQDAGWPIVVALAYILGGTINQSLNLAMHENSHNTVFSKNYFMTRVFGIIINLPVGVPASISFKKYHADHHQYMGDNIKDQDIPTYLEAWLFQRTFTKMIWLVLNPFFYALRPVFVYPKPITRWEITNFVIQIIFNAAVIHFFGCKAMFYLLGGSLLAMGLHPMAGHFISEHYLFFGDQQTSSYYGILNYISWNVGYHNEHHDFPWISYRKLPKLKEMAPEFYDLPHHTSWVKCLVDFVMDPAIGPYARMRQAPDRDQTSAQAPFDKDREIKMD